MRVVVVPSTLALRSAYGSLEDPIAPLRVAVAEAVAWLTEPGPAGLIAGSAAAERIGAELLGDRYDPAAPYGRLVVANGSARRTEKAPGHFDDRAAGYDAGVGAALAAGDLAALAGIDTELAAELWAMPDAAVLRDLSTQLGTVSRTQVDYDDDPYGVQYWVVRWECAS